VPTINFSYTTDQDRLKGKAQNMKERGLSRKHQQAKGVYNGGLTGSNSMLTWRDLKPIGEAQQDGQKDLATHLPWCVRTCAFFRSKTAAGEETSYSSVCARYIGATTGMKLMDFSISCRLNAA
jgi:coproporphyrinogen III oxidase-like Fe-S oxidoreductase